MRIPQRGPSALIIRGLWRQTLRKDIMQCLVMMCEKTAGQDGISDIMKDETDMRPILTGPA